jgi:hypothetical protein
VRLLACLAVLSCVLPMQLGCGGSDQPGPAGSPSGGGTTTGSPTDGGTIPPVGPYGYIISGSGFSPEELVVPAGATITITNADNAPHSLTSNQAHLQIK